MEATSSSTSPSLPIRPQTSPDEQRPIVPRWVVLFTLLVIALAVGCLLLMAIRPDDAVSAVLPFILILSVFVPIAAAISFAHRQFITTRAVVCGALACVIGHVVLVLADDQRQFHFHDRLIVFLGALFTSALMACSFGTVVKIVNQALGTAGDLAPRKRVALAAMRGAWVGLVPGLIFGALVSGIVTLFVVSRGHLFVGWPASTAFSAGAVVLGIMIGGVLGMPLGIAFFAILAILPAAIYRPHADPRS